MYGTQAFVFISDPLYPFENDVNMYGTQARNPSDRTRSPFENDVNMYGTQAIKVLLIN